MKRAAGLLLSIVLSIGVLTVADAKQYMGATYQDIMSAMGPDALGLEITADKLPDIATLKESRFEEQPDKFIVEHPYTGGRWKGGKARVEYARDLSYALVSIYDKHGKRQRIYSVKARPSEGGDDLASAVTAASSVVPAASPVKTPTPVEPPPVVQATAPQPSAQEPAPAPKKKHHHRSDVPIEVAVANPSGSNTWVPVAQPSQPAATTVTPIPAVVKTVASPVKSAPEPVPQSPAAGFVWDESLGAYVPEKGHAGAQANTQNAVAASVPSTEELLGTTASNSNASSAVQETPAPEPKHSKKKKKSQDEMPSAQPPAEPSIAPAPAQPVVSSDDKALIAKAKQDLAQAETSNSKAEQAAQTATAPSPEAASGPAGPDTSDSDRWVPKATKVAPASEPVIPQPVKVAMLPKTAPPPDASIDNLLKISGQNPSAAAAESDAWVPKNTKLPKADADVIAELNRIKAQKPVPVPVVKVNRDINNPEEGVLPANSFEKFVGPRYGRHREYERRLMFGKKPQSKVKEYDFYVDEVDRKKEIHNVYYYKKGKVPKLVAVEKHYNVTFLSNYDVDKEDKGKISLE